MMKKKQNVKPIKAHNQIAKMTQLSIIDKLLFISIITQLSRYLYRARIINMKLKPLLIPLGYSI